MPDVVVTVPQSVCWDWLLEGDCAGDPPMDEEWDYSIGGRAPRSKPGDRVYVVAWGRLRGYAPLLRIHEHGFRSYGLIRGGGAVAVTIAAPIQGFRGWRYRWWERGDELAFPDWKLSGVPPAELAKL